jgi:hypothetical protein
MGPPPKWRTGELQRVPCPYPDCGKLNDFRGTEEFLFEKKAQFDCDHCRRTMEVVRAIRTILVSVRVPDRRLQGIPGGA